MIRHGFSTSQAAGAYAGAQKLAGSGASAAAKSPVPASNDSFVDLLGRAVGGVAESGRKAEAISTAAAMGAKPDLVDVVTAIAESESALETLVSVRDKVIQAYEEIMRMPI